MFVGVNFLEKKVKLKKKIVTFIVWDLGGKKEFKDYLFYNLTYQ